MCSYDCSVHPTSIDGDNDITGIGVLISYCATAGIAVFIIVFHYFACYDPGLDPFRENQANALSHFHPRSRTRTNPIDDFILREPRKLFRKALGSHFGGQKNGSRIEESFIKCILSMSDIQIITGISIVISGATQLKCGISTYQWQVLVYLAWFSSVTHLSCLTLLRNYLHQRPAERIWRLVCMFILVVLLSLAFLPTANYRWQYAPPNGSGRPAPQDYAICYLRPVSRLNEVIDDSPTLFPNDHSFSEHAIIAMSISVILMSVGFFSRVLKLYQSPATFLSKTARGKASAILRKPLRIIDRSCDGSNFFQNLKRLLMYRPLLALFLTGRILVDIWDSMFFEIWWLVISFVWGISRLFSVVDLIPSEDNAQWSFGQVMSVALLAIPLVTVFELLYPESEHKGIEESQAIMCSYSMNESDGSLDVFEFGQQPAPVPRDLASQSFNDHPDYKFYYESGSLTTPTLTLILMIVIISLWCLIQACMMKSGLQAQGLLQISFFPWGAIPSILSFCVYNSILFTFMVARLRPKSRDGKETSRSLIRVLSVLVTLMLISMAFMMFWFSVTVPVMTMWFAIAVFGFYFLCSLAASARY